MPVATDKPLQALGLSRPMPLTARRTDMGALDIAAALGRRPFEPFRIVTSDGIVYDVRHPEMLMVSVTSAVVGFPDPDRQRVATRFDIVALEHIVRLEQMPQSAPAKSDGT
jgi:hypothetical protein